MAASSASRGELVSVNRPHCTEECRTDVMQFLTSDLSAAVY